MLDNIIEIAQRASNIRERVAHYKSHQTYINDPQSKYYAEKFRKYLTPKKKDQSLIKARLKYLGLQESNLIEAFGCVPVYSKSTLPDWAQLLLTILSDYERNESSLQDNRFQTSDGMLIFPELLHPFTSYFDKKLENITAKVSFAFEAQSIHDLKDELLAELSEVTARVVSAQLSMRRHFSDKTENNCSTKEKYEEYMAQYLGSSRQHISLFLYYPVLARLLCTKLSQTLDNLTNFANRFESDRSEICKYFLPEENRAVNLSVARLSFKHSDPHNRGQKVWKITTNHSFSLAYKPRSYLTDLAYANLIQWYNSSKTHHSLSTAPFIARPDYGWTLWIHDDKNLKREEDVSIYYQRFGAHCAILFLLNATDFHEENFIANKSDPIPIDLETIGSSCMSYYTPEDESNLPFYLEPVSLSIQALGAYPRWLNNKGKYSRALVLGGIAGRHSTDNTSMVVRWENVGTDQLSHCYVETPVKSISLSPQINGHAHELIDYIDDYLTGFQDAYSYFLKNKSFLLESNDSPFMQFKGVSTRIVLRNTQEYFDLLQPATSHDLLTNGLAYDVFLEKICNRPLGNYAQNLYFTSETETKALFNRDIPYFSGTIGITNFGDENSKTSIDENPIAFEHKLKTSSTILLQKYKQQIRSVFRSYRQSIQQPSLLSEKTNTSRPNKEIIVEGLDNIKELFLDSMITMHGVNGWYSLYSYADNPTLAWRFPIPWTSTGIAGTSVFFANAGRLLGHSELSRLAEKLSLSSLHELKNHFGLADQYSLALCKGLEGIASPIYACLCAHRFSQSVRALEDAVDFVESIGTNYKNIKLRDLSLISGASADLIVLSELYQRTQRPLLKEIISVLAMKLVMALESLNSFLNTNPHLQPIEPGVAHGIFGILLAIDRANDVEPKDIYRSVILNYGYKEMKRYLDQPNERDERFTGWCRGPAGEGLAILDNQLLLNSHLSTMANDYIDTTLDLTKRSLGQDFVHLCCGESGRLIFLATAGEKLNRPDLSDLAVNQSVNLLRQYADTGYLRMQSLTSSCLIPGLSDGHAGIGLGLLSVLYPKSTSNYLCLR